MGMEAKVLINLRMDPEVYELLKTYKYEGETDPNVIRRVIIAFFKRQDEEIVKSRNEWQEELKKFEEKIDKMSNVQNPFQMGQRYPNQPMEIPASLADRKVNLGK